MAFIVDSASDGANLSSVAGGKATNLWRLSQYAFCNVPPWFCITTNAFDAFIEKSDLQSLLRVEDDLEGAAKAVEAKFDSSPLPEVLENEIDSRLHRVPFADHFVAVRSSGTDEDSAAHSFAGQFETFLFQKGGEQIRAALRKCWASCFSARVMQHRKDCGLALSGVKMAVVIQVMVNSEYSGVAFSRHPLKPMSSGCSYIEAVYGLGEGLVGGELSSDSYEVNRDTLQVTKTLIEKEYQFLQAESGGVEKVSVPADKKDKSVLTDEEAIKICQLISALERELGHPQDFEYAFEKETLYCLQTRPIVTLPPACFFNFSAIGMVPTLWDNSNIVESYSGVTTPLTFSFASYAYARVYTLSMLIAGVPQSVVQRHELPLRNMLGYVRGNIYYNLMNWYRCLSCIPIGNTGKFMETMMGVKQSLDADLEAQLGHIADTAPKYGLWTKTKVLAGLAYEIYRIDGRVESFFENFNYHYKKALATNFETLSLTQQLDYFRSLLSNVVDKWEVPIYNDTYVMLFFGLLKKLVTSFLCSGDSDKAQSLQNDLLCGQGDVESTKPTKMLMKIAEYVDTSGSALREWFLTEREELLHLIEHQLSDSKPVAHDDSKLRTRRSSAASLNRRVNSESGEDIEGQKVEVSRRIKTFLTLYGFRCVDELKLESTTLLDDPTFVLDTLCGYIRSGSYSVDAMEKREHEIKTKAEELVAKSLPFYKRIFFNWILSHARRAVKHRENLRFARTKLWGILRSLFRAIGVNLKKLGMTDNKEDVFYLTIDELSAYNEGRSVTNNLRQLVAIRREEIDEYRKTLPPPERFMTRGAPGCYMVFPAILEDLDLLKEHEALASSDPNVLLGTPCCPGVIQGKVRVVNRIEEARGMNGEILVTARTDPGWVPLYPVCSGLLIERGSLLSHSAVVARELGLPTVVGVSGGLMKRLKTGMTVHVDAGKGKITILEEDSQSGNTRENSEEEKDHAQNKD